MHAGTALPAPARLMRGSDQHPQPLISAGMGRCRPAPPRVGPARRDLKNPTHRAHVAGGLLRLETREPYIGSLAKKAAACLKIFRSARKNLLPQPPQILVRLCRQIRAARRAVSSHVFNLGLVG